MESVVAQLELIGIGYHGLSDEELEMKDDVEARFEQGRRLLYSSKLEEDQSAGWRLVTQAAHSGHPVAMACCCEDFSRAEQLLRASASRGHAAGNQSRVLYTMAPVPSKMFVF
jgi:hypothetical protein